MTLAPAIRDVLNRYPAERRQDILQRAQAVASAEVRAVSVTDIRLAGVPSADGRARLQPSRPSSVPSAPVRPIAGEPLPFFLTVGEVAARLDVSPEHVAGLIDSGDVVAIDIGAVEGGRAAYRIIRDSLLNFEAKRTTAVV